MLSDKFARRVAQRISEVKIMSTTFFWNTIGIIFFDKFKLIADGTDVL